MNSRYFFQIKNMNVISILFSYLYRKVIVRDPKIPTEIFNISFIFVHKRYPQKKKILLRKIGALQSSNRMKLKIFL